MSGLPDSKYEPKPSYMKYVKWIFVVWVVCSLVSFIDKGKVGYGRSVGDKAPDFSVVSGDGEQLQLRALRGGYVLLSFWASYDAASRVQNLQLCRATAKLPGRVKMVSVSFDEYKSVFDATVREDKIGKDASFVEVSGESSSLFKKYRLDRGFDNYLLDEEGVIIAKNVTAEKLADLLM